MKALVLREYNRLVLEELPEPVPGPGEVLVRVRAGGICGSDVHGLDGSTGRRVPPLVMGHEAAGEIAALGKGVTDLQVGRRVTFDSTIYCGRCAFCRAGQINLCDHRQVLGVSCEEYRRDGAFAEYVAVPSRSIYPLPEGLSFERAALVEPLSVAVHAVDRLAPREGERAVVLGAGVIGLLALQVLKARGCGRVIAVDLDRGRLELARELGADQTFAPEKGTDVAAELVRLAGGAGLDLAVEAVGLPATVETAVNCLRKGGRAALVGNFSPRVELPLQRIVARELSLLGSCASAGEYPECLRLIAEGKIRVDRLISATAPLSEGAAWFDRLYRGEPGLLKVCLLP